MTAVIYARYSSDNQREASIEGQLRDCKDYAEKNGITVVGTYIDRAYSAKTDDRPDFQRMIKDSAKKIFDVVLVWKLDRFARNRYDAVNYKYQLEKNGITVVGTYIDRAYSAKTDDRPDFQRMIKDSAKKIFDVVLVWKLDRFARNRFDAVNYKYQLEKNGTAV